MTVAAPRDDLNLPYLTADMAGIGGVIKTYDEDFVVDELPRYEASGRGTHTYLTIEKRGLTTPEAINILAKRLKRRPGEFGYAGLKDAHGITRQRLSIEHVDAGALDKMELPQIRILQTDRHTNKIKLGHLAGNRFMIRLRDCAADPLDRARTVLEELHRRGLPHYFGSQRFGIRGDNAEVGLCVLRQDHAAALTLMLGRPEPFERPEIREARRRFDAGDYRAAADAWPKRFRDQARLCVMMAEQGGDARRTWRAVRQQQRKFYFSALQSLLFNQVVARRIQEIDRLWEGDVAWIHRNGACFRVEDLPTEQPRCEAFEISATGPLFGSKMKTPSGRATALEEDVLRDAGLSRSEVESPERARLDGARRPLRVPLADTNATTGEDQAGAYLEVRFVLPPGAYATVVTRELTKTSAGA